MATRERVVGMGGFWAIPGSGHEGIVQHTALYEVVLQGITHDLRTVGCGGFVECLPVAKKVESAFFRVAETATDYAMAIGFRVNEELPVVYLRRGGREEFDRLTAAVVKTARRIVDSRRAVFCEITCAGGQYAYSVPLGLILPTVGDAGGGGDF